MIDWISKIDIVRPSSYGSNPSNPTPIYGSIPGSLVLECALPTESIKSDDDFFAGDAQEIEIVLFYNSNLITDQLFLALTETAGLNGRYTDELNGDIVKIYNRDSVCVFDGVIRVDGKSFNTEDFTIKFKVFNLMRLFKERALIVANDADGTVGKPISFLNMTATEFAFYANSAFKEFKWVAPYTGVNNWSSSPMQIVNNAPKMGIDQWFGSDVNPHDELSSVSISRVVSADYYYYGSATNGAVRMVYISKESNDRYYVYVFYISHPWNIVSYKIITTGDFGMLDVGFETKEDAISAVTNNGVNPIIEYNGVSLHGVSYALQFVQAADQRRIRLKGMSGKWQASNLKILSTATIGQVVKLFLLLCGWKMSIKKNVIAVTQNYYSSLSGITTINPTVSQIKDFATNTILPYSPLDSDIYDILDESDTAKTAIKSAVETNYNRYLPKITKEVDFAIHSTAGAPFVGCFVVTPIVPGVPHYPGQTWNRTYFVYEITQDQDDTDWYNCKAYNIN